MATKTRRNSHDTNMESKLPMITCIRAVSKRNGSIYDICLENHDLFLDYIYGDYRENRYTSIEKIDIMRVKELKKGDDVYIWSYEKDIWIPEYWGESLEELKRYLLIRDLAKV